MLQTVEIIRYTIKAKYKLAGVAMTTFFLCLNYIESQMIIKT